MFKFRVFNKESTKLEVFNTSPCFFEVILFSGFFDLQYWLLSLDDNKWIFESFHLSTLIIIVDILLTLKAPTYLILIFSIDKRTIDQ